VQLTPRYDGEPIMRMDGVVGDPATPLLRQRARLAGVLAGLDDGQWAEPSRCAGWSVRDVVAHLATTNQFWALSIGAGVGGAPTRYLAGFDPVATPAQLVDAVASWTPAETLDRFTASSDDLAKAVDGLDERSWSALGEAPPGHVAVRLVALHALWDSWVHERDIVVPLGLDPVEEADEIAASLAYVVALGPVFRATTGSTRTGAVEVVATDPDVRIVVEVGPTVVVHAGPCPAGAATLAGDAVALVEALSFRAPFTATMAEGDRWLLGGLDVVFDRTG
jgi:uncharacterized protein (TIGR03083 family)